MQILRQSSERCAWRKIFRTAQNLIWKPGKPRYSELCELFCGTQYGGVWWEGRVEIVGLVAVHRTSLSFDGAYDSVWWEGCGDPVVIWW